MTLLNAIRELEKACLSSDSKPTTKAEIRANGREETKRYFQWLRHQAPMTSMMIPEFEALS